MPSLPDGGAREIRLSTGENAMPRDDPFANAHSVYLSGMLQTRAGEIPRCAGKAAPLGMTHSKLNGAFERET